LRVLSLQYYCFSLPLRRLIGFASQPTLKVKIL